jgi:hypothetical protein
MFENRKKQTSLSNFEKHVCFGLIINLKNIEFEDCPYIFYYDK